MRKRLRLVYKSYIYVYSLEKITDDSHTSHKKKTGRKEPYLHDASFFFFLIIVAEQHSLAPTLTIEETNAFSGD